MEHTYFIRDILPEDNAGLAIIIRQTLKEFGANKPGTVYYDESTDHLSAVFTKKGSCYFVVTVDGVLVGGAGIFPTHYRPGWYSCAWEWAGLFGAHQPPFFRAHVWAGATRHVQQPGTRIDELAALFA